MPSFPQVLPFPLGPPCSHASAFCFCSFASVLEISYKWIPAARGLFNPASLARRSVSEAHPRGSGGSELPAFFWLNNIPPCGFAAFHFPSHQSRSVCVVPACWLSQVVPLWISPHERVCAPAFSFLAWICAPTSGIAGSYANSLLTPWATAYPPDVFSSGCSVLHFHQQVTRTLIFPSFLL